MYTCDICDKVYRRRDNMLRHKKHSHVESSEEEDLESLSSETDDHASDNTDDYISDENDDDTSGGHMDELYDPWEGVIQKAFDKCDERYKKEVEKLMKMKKMSKSDAGRRIYRDMQSEYRKAIMTIFMNRITWYEAIRKDRIYKAIKKTAANLIELDDYEPEEAWKSAVSQRKYLFDTLLENYEPADIATESNDEQDQEMDDSDSDDDDTQDEDRDDSDSDDDDTQDEDREDNNVERTFPMKRKYDDFQPMVIGK